MTVGVTISSLCGYYSYSYTLGEAIPLTDGSGKSQLPNETLSSFQYLLP